MHRSPRENPTGGADPEFEDEAPGAYLLELRAGVANLVWAGVNVVSTGVVALAWFGAGLAPGVDVRPSWWVPAQLVWSLLPVSGALLVIVTLWQLLNGYSRTRGRAGPAGLGLAVLALILWFWLRRELQIDFSDPPR